MKVLQFISKNRTPGIKLIYAPPNLSVVLDIDHFNQNIRKELTPEQLENLETRDFLIWGNWFSIIERGVTKEELDI